jgi:hypothetical protein
MYRQVNCVDIFHPLFGLNIELYAHLVDRLQLPSDALLSVLSPPRVSFLKESPLEISSCAG